MEESFTTRTGRFPGQALAKLCGSPLARSDVVIGEEPLRTTLGKSVPEQQNEALRQEAAQQRDAKLSVDPMY